MFLCIVVNTIPIVTEPDVLFLLDQALPILLRVRQKQADPAV